MQFTLDCSVSAAWCFSDEKSAYVDDVLASFTKGAAAVVPYIWYLEMLNVFRSAEKRARLSRAGSEHFVSMFSALPISAPPIFEPVLDRNLLYVAGLYGLSVYDACYLKTAMDMGIPLATQDVSLIKACEAAGVSRFPN